MRCSTSRCRRSSCCSSPCRARKVSSGSLHVDNISPSLFGGLVLTVGIDNPRVKQIPVPEGIRAVLVHPHLFLSTKQARGILKREVTMSDFIWQTANLAGFISGCYTNDLDMIRASFEDVVIEKQRSQLIPGFDAVRKGAIDAGALGCTISGAGPTMFAWALESDAEKVRAAMVAAFGAAEHESGSLGRAHQDRGRARAAGLSAHEDSSALAAQSPAGQFRRRHLPRASRPMAACTCRRPGRAFRCRLSMARPRCRKWPRSCCGRSSKAIPSPPEIGDIVRDAFDFPAPLVPVADDGKLSVLELFHGPTAAFKDFGARFLAASLARIRNASAIPASRSTSWWPPPATPAARWPRRFIAGPASSCPCCSRRAWCRPRRSASSPAGATTSSRIASTARFDDCQRLVKEAFVDDGAQAALRTVERQQHQSRAPAAAGGVLRRHQPRGASRARRRA